MEWRRWRFWVSVALWSSLGSAFGCGGPEESPAPAAALSCTCDNLGVGETRSLDCFRETFPDACPAYEVTTRMRACSGAEPKGVLRESSCATEVFLVDDVRGTTTTCVYDPRSRELVYARREGEATCRRGSYDAGVQPACEAPAQCSLCERSLEACVPYAADPEDCTVEALCSSDSPDCVSYHRTVRLLACRGVDFFHEPTLSRGCGRVRVTITPWVDEWYSYEFDEATRELVWVSQYDRRHHPGQRLECNGSWGTRTEVCREEVKCSLCAGAEDVCSFSMLQGP